MDKQFFNVKRKMLESWFSVEGLTDADTRIQRREERLKYLYAPKIFIKGYMAFQLSSSDQPINYDSGGSGPVEG